MAKGKYQEWLTQENLTLLEGWARDGLTDEQIAHNMGIKRQTLYDWKKKYPDISDALKRGKEVVDRQVENSLLKRALGYEYEEVTKELINGTMLITKKVKKYQPPDTTAAIFWLKNRRPDKWRDKRDVEHSGKVANKIDLSGLSIEELRKLAELDE
ncbi:transposase [Aeribacillus pallidus]|uniref:transposase n=1 Tax=Aeribacillus pallidus TaxID=33936 RepID=UPI0007B4B4BF|nr:transposase [Aeribacillus pallidus]KZM54922.1 transposase [Aeribacillus pallidus]